MYYDVFCGGGVNPRDILVFSPCRSLGAVSEFSTRISSFQLCVCVVQLG